MAVSWIKDQQSENFPVWMSRLVFSLCHNPKEAGSNSREGMPQQQQKMNKAARLKASRQMSKFFLCVF